MLKKFLWVAGFLLAFPVLSAWADGGNINVSCSSATVSAPMGGGSVTANVDCIINNQNSTGAYRITPASANLLVPASIVLTNGTNTVVATRNPAVTSPDGTVSSISGTSAGFTASLSNTSADRLRFQYTITTLSATPAGTYSAFSNAAYYQYQICNTPSCSQSIYNSIANVALSVSVPQSPVSVSCGSPAVNASPGGGSFSLTVVCTVSSGNAGQFAPSNRNFFAPGSVTLTNGTAFLTATLQPTVTSPDNSVTGIIGTAGGGFTGTMPMTPAKIEVQYTGSTKPTTPAGTYTSSPVTLTWSTL